MATQPRTDRPTEDRDSDIVELESAIDTFMEEDSLHDQHLSQTALAWLKGRFIGEIRWFERRAESTKYWHYVLRIIAISGGVLVPAMIAFAGSNQGKGWNSLRVAASLVSVVVALAVGLDGFFHWGERWMRYRQTAEFLKAEGWSYLEGIGAYKHKVNENPASSFASFASRVEGAIRQDVAAFLTTIAPDHSPDDHQPGAIGQEAARHHSPDDHQPGAIGQEAARENSPEHHQPGAMS